MLFHEVTPGSVLKSGYILINNTDCCWHAWVEHEDHIFDLGIDIAKRRDPGFAISDVDYFTEPPAMVKPTEDKEIVDRFNGHIADFWKTAPKEFRDFRSEFKRTVNR
jgi:hypothetical protein